MTENDSIRETDLLVIGGGPGGYHAAFRAASNGIETLLVEAETTLGGVCLLRGCIPSKTYLSIAEAVHSAAACRDMGIEFQAPRFDIDAIRGRKEQVVSTLAGGLDKLSKKYKVDRLCGTARFLDSQHVAIEGSDVDRVKFQRAVIATGSRSITLKGIQVESPRVLTSRTALDLADIPETLLVIGGGYIGLELGQVYAAFGSKVTVVEMLPNLLPGVDRDLGRPLLRRLEHDFEAICLETKVTSMKEIDGGIELTFEGKNPPESTRFDKVLVSVGRRPNSDDLCLESAGVEVDGHGFIQADSTFATTAENIYAIGDVIGNPMLAHKALHEGNVLADRLAGKDSVFQPRAIPAVVFTDPAVAWAGYTEAEAKEKGLDFVMKKMPWSASGRAVSLGRTDGLTKLMFEKDSQRLIGIGLTGLHAGEMIAEGVLALEMGATAHDLARTIHPHPTLSETIGEVASLVPGA